MSSALLLDCSRVTADYGRITVVHGVDLQARGGEVLAVLGANGAGKSSLFGAIAGTVRGGGVIRLNGTDLSAVPAHRRASAGLAFVPEARRNIFRVLSVAENLEIGLHLGVPADRPATLDFIHSLFPILRDRRDVPAGMLSGGEQQMLAIGVALGRRPHVLILDEPTQGLAPTIFDVLQDAMARLCDLGVAVVVAEQNLSFAARVADRYFVLSHGRVVASGDASSMLDEERMSALYFGRTAEHQSRT
ncbi:MAG TPA: ABC transporter ATP-binding protein [Devosiaceae bacterium]|jgi:branched-chain amino acid transport system ATP-binding protein